MLIILVDFLLSALLNMYNPEFAAGSLEYCDTNGSEAPPLPVKEMVEEEKFGSSVFVF